MYYIYLAFLHVIPNTGLLNIMKELEVITSL